MMPAALSDSREGGLAEPHLELMTEDEADDQFLAVAASALAARDGRGKNVGGMRRVLFPVNVVVIHATDHQRIRQRRRNWIHALPGADHRGRTRAGDFIENRQRNLDVVLLVAAQGAAERIE